MESVRSLLKNENLGDVYLGLASINRQGYVDRGVPLPFLEEDFGYTLTVMKGITCYASRMGWDLNAASVMGLIHEMPEGVTGIDRIPDEVTLDVKYEDESAAMRSISGRPGLDWMFDVWEDSDLMHTDLGKACRHTDKSITSPAVVAYINNMDSIVRFYRDNPEWIEDLVSLKRYEGVHEKDVFDVMRASFEEFHDYAIDKIKVGPVFVDAINEVRGMKTKDVGKIFDRYYEVLAGDAWGEMRGRDFLMDRLARDKVGLRKMRVSRKEVLGLIG
ncbi:hypothetical protein HNV12_01095 [Methanococcoides sp. SA1]|nr:hypothetical protein [Methanococcoides sp. SA1]